MADDDVRKGLGIKRRRPADTATDDGPAAEPKASGSGLGIKRRSGPSVADDSGESAPAAPKGGGSGLGIKRRSGPTAGADGSAGGADAAAPAEDAAPPEPEVFDPLLKWRPKLGNDDTGVQLANHFRHRTELPDMLPPRCWELQRTHGRYSGDGRAEREIKIGWKPAMVMFTIPVYPDGPPSFDKKWQLVEPGLHRQPKFTENGFVVEGRLNVVGDWYCYIVWRCDGEPLEFTEPEDPRAKAQAKAQTKPKGSGPSLGITRRK
jgi:hypothetical protein